MNSKNMHDEEMGSPHYERGSLIERLNQALSAEEFKERTPLAKDLAPLDQFHTRGLDATIELAQALNLDQSTHVLDIGSGLGGPSRYLAAQYGCSVRGIDLSQSFVDAANFLAEKTGMASLVAYECANALALPFDAETFDVAWTQHVAMNIANRDELYREAFRVLRPGGRLAIFDVIVGSGAPLHFPVPWATTPASSFLLTESDMRTSLLAQGFQVTEWIDSTAAGVSWFKELERNRESKKPASALGLHLVMGPGFREMASNLALNLSEGRVALVQAILQKP